MENHEQVTCSVCGAILLLYYPQPGQPAPITNYCPFCHSIIGGGAINVVVVSGPHSDIGDRETEEYTCETCGSLIMLVHCLTGEAAPITVYCPVCGNILGGAGCCVTKWAIETSPPECLIDADCPALHYCSHGKCIPEEIVVRTVEESSCINCGATFRLTHALSGEPSSELNYCPYCGTVIGTNAIDVETLTGPAVGGTTTVDLNSIMAMMMVVMMMGMIMPMMSKM